MVYVLLHDEISIQFAESYTKDFNNEEILESRGLFCGYLLLVRNKIIRKKNHR